MKNYQGELCKNVFQNYAKIKNILMILIKFYIIRMNNPRFPYFQTLCSDFRKTKFIFIEILLGWCSNQQVY